MTPAPSRPFAVIADDTLGIGLELAQRFASDGYDLLVAADRSRHEVFAHELERFDVQVALVDVDLETARGVSELVDRIRADAREPDAVAVAGGLPSAPCVSANALWQLASSN